ncbi:MAG: hypothetical protein QXF50_02270, partial [Sulfolobales archaeon]
SLEDSMREISSREDSMKERFKRFYNIDMNDLSVFDLIINTDRIDEETALEIAIAAVKMIINKKMR